jgi:hypothetical protein
LQIKSTIFIPAKITGIIICQHDTYSISCMTNA